MFYHALPKTEVSSQLKYNHVGRSVTFFGQGAFGMGGQFAGRVPPIEKSCVLACLC